MGLVGLVIPQGAYLQLDAPPYYEPGSIMMWDVRLCRGLGRTEQL